MVGDFHAKISTTVNGFTLGYCAGTQSVVVRKPLNLQRRWRTTFMRMIAFVLAGALAVCFMDPASAATKRSAASASANSDKSAYPASANCGGSGYCYRSGTQKIQKKH